MIGSKQVPPELREFVERERRGFRRRAKRQGKLSGWQRHPGVSTNIPSTLVEKPTAFELEVKRLGLEPERYACSISLRRWVRDHRRAKYVPESLLKEMGFDDSDICIGF